MTSSFPSLYFTKLVLQQKYHIIWPLSIFFNLLPVFQTFKIFFKSFLLWLIFGFHKFFLSSTPRNNFDIFLKFIHYYYLRLKFDRFKQLNIFFFEIFIILKNYRFFYKFTLSWSPGKNDQGANQHGDSDWDDNIRTGQKVIKIINNNCEIVQHLFFLQISRSDHFWIFLYFFLNQFGKFSRVSPAYANRHSQSQPTHDQKHFSL